MSPLWPPLVSLDTEKGTGAEGPRDGRGGYSERREEARGEGWTLQTFTTRRQRNERKEEKEEGGEKKRNKQCPLYSTRVPHCETESNLPYVQMGKRSNVQILKKSHGKRKINVLPASGC